MARQTPKSCRSICFGKFLRRVRLDLLVPTSIPTPIGVYRLYQNGVVVYVGRSAGHLYRRIRAAARTLADRWGVKADAVSVCPERDEWEAHWREVAEFEKGGSALFNEIKPARPAGYLASCRQRRDCRR